MNNRFLVTKNHENNTWYIHESTGRIIADSIPTAAWAEAIAEWMNSLELVPEEDN